MKTYSVRITEQLCTYRTVTLAIDAVDCDAAAQLAYEQAKDAAAWSHSDSPETGYVDFEVSAPDEATHTWRED